MKYHIQVIASWCLWSEIKCTYRQICKFIQKINNTKMKYSKKDSFGAWGTYS